MKRRKNIYKNLAAEIGRQNLTIAEMASAIGITRYALMDRLSGKSRLLLQEAINLWRCFFQECDFINLFSEEK